MQDFYNFWREEFTFVHREFGCAVMCMAAKFDMITDENKLHHGNAHQFAKEHGAGSYITLHNWMAVYLGILDNSCYILNISTSEAILCFEIRQCQNIFCRFLCTYL